MASSLAKVKIRRAGRKLSWQSWSVGRLVNNVADKPVRLDVTELVAEGIDRVNIDWGNLWERIQKYDPV